MFPRGRFRSNNSDLHSQHSKETWLTADKKTRPSGRVFYLSLTNSTSLQPANTLSPMASRPKIHGNSDLGGFKKTLTIAARKARPPRTSRTHAPISSTIMIQPPLCASRGVSSGIGIFALQSCLWPIVIASDLVDNSPQYRSRRGATPVVQNRSSTTYHPRPQPTSQTG
jgi:hypothetical protein